MSGSSASAPGSTISSTLWAHLLNKDAGASGSGSGLRAGLTPVGLTNSAPADRTGTSVRVLLHDTQVTIEKFSEKVDKLVSEAEDSHRKLLARNEEVSDEVERLVRGAIQEQGTSLLSGIAPQTLLLSGTCPSIHVPSNLCAYIDQMLRLFGITSGPSGNCAQSIHPGARPSPRSRGTTPIHFKLPGCFESEG